MNIQHMQPMHKLCMAISEIKQQLIADELPHYGKQALYFQNNEITTGLINNKIEIKIHLSTGQLLYFNDEKGHFIDLFTDDITDRLQKITEIYGLKGSEPRLENLDFEKISSFRDYAVPAIKMLELFRMTLRGNFTLIHLWPHHFDFSLEWFTGNADEQIGTGISPGDEHYSEPYLYMNPYPFNEQVTSNELPLGIWHTSGWQGVKIEWKDLLKYPPTNAVNKLHEVFETVRKNFNGSN
ncbi:MAG: hypothetical protein ACR2LL_06510 [Nitrosopumilus sp.]